MGASDALAIVHGGGPTAVINASLYGAVREALADGRVGRVLGALGGVDGILEGRYVDFADVPTSEVELLPFSPSSALGTSRRPLDGDDYQRLAEALRRDGVRWLLCTGGNGTMDTCGKIFDACQGLGYAIDVVGVPKTMDNDIAVTDHAPGYGSAARYLAASTSEVCCDVRGLPIHVVIVEAMGRDAGWVTAASALAKDSGTGGPDLIYVPERPFGEKAFLEDVQHLIDEKGSGVVVASEGLRTATGEPVVEPIMSVGRATYFGDVSSYLAQLVVSELGYKARSEKPGLLGRASIAWQSPIDREEAVRAGREAVRAALAGDTGVMVGFEREVGEHYAARCVRIPLSRVALTARTLPDAYINERGNGVTEEFCRWCRPLLGPALPRFASFV
ncbi:MAG: diphosphate--fructose-6-phosphate 1-phosphotransferase [Coriobacteriaceae bacterium]|nr:diphosphate--fructose-6-phosphate 1-phosphotransferase [Coriobacteriaceae bacterium]